MMDQNNYGPFGIFFFNGPIFLVRHMCGVFLYLSRILTGSRAREARATTACVGRKLGMGLPGPQISRDAPPTCGTESSEWVYRATYEPRCPANVQYRKLGMGLKMDKFKKKGLTQMDQK